MNIWANCDNCKHDDNVNHYCRDCIATRPPSKWEPSENYVPPTNADHIRSMTDEELAEFIPNWSYTDACKCGEHYVDCNNECEKCVAEWLQQPYEEEK